MHRIFGRKKEAAAPPPPPDLDAHANKLNSKGTELDGKIAAIDGELAKLKQQIAAARTPAAQASLKKRALQLLQRKRMYEGHRDAYAGRAANMERVAFAVETTKEAREHFEAMKYMASQLKDGASKVRGGGWSGGGR